jgi:hypothetical protein
MYVPLPHPRTLAHPASSFLGLEEDVKPKLLIIIIIIIIIYFTFQIKFMFFL